MKKRIALFILALSLALALTVGASAAETAQTQAPIEDDQATAAAEEALPKESAAIESGDAAEKVDAPKGGLSDWMSSLFQEHSAEIFSVLSLLGSVLVAILYKMGLLPLLSKNLAGIQRAAGGTAESTAALTESMDCATQRIGSAVESTASSMEQLRQTVGNAAEKLEELQTSLDGARSDNERMRLILKGQTELIYGVLQAAALPQYQKDAINEQYLAMQRALAAMEEASA